MRFAFGAAAAGILIYDSLNKGDAPAMDAPWRA
jgi:hypothetical protein